DRHIVVSEAGQPNQPLPVCRHECARDRDSSVTQNKMMPASKPCQNTEPVIRHPMAMQVGDEPAATRVRIHPMDKLYDLIIGQVMGELRADDEIEDLVLIESKCIARTIRDRHISGLAGGSRCPRVEVDTFEPRSYLTSVCPATNCPQSIAISARDIQQRK